ncbi:hypothetical protein ACNFCJ_09100 [Pseudomonas sp. NY15364]|uniref:hypothetical protein n=1 Tax=Pseudomonas sp. NY15364 TaxID=3400353 RepID=UPI003A8B4C1A
MSRDDSVHKAVKKLTAILSSTKEESLEQAGKGIVFDNEEYEAAANRQDNYLEDLFKARTSNMRLFNFAWLFLKFKEDAKFEEFNFGTKESTLDDIESFMLDVLTSHTIASALAEEILREFNRRAVQPEKLTWAIGPRTSRWIKNKITPFDRYQIKRLPNISGPQLTQAIFDFMDADLSAKIAHLEELKTQWDQNLKTDHHLKWLDDKVHGKERRELAWAALCEKYPDRFNVVRAPSKHQDFLEIFDQLAEEGVSKRDFIKSLKGKESKLKTANKGRKAKNLDILLENHPRLKKLAEHWAVPECIALDRLISEAHEKEFGKE